MINVLVVDDKKANRYLLETLMRSRGYNVISTENGVEALKQLEETEFQLIISDILMPEMDGYQLCRECKKNKRFSNIPFVFYTATYTEVKDEKFALALGADRFIRKPLEPDKILEQIQEVLDDTSHRRKGKKPSLKHEAEIYKIYSQRLVKKLEKKMLDLEISEKLYRTIFNNANDAIYLNQIGEDNRPGKFIQVNKVACDLLGYTMSEFLKLRPYDLDTPEYFDTSSSVLSELLEKGAVTFRTDNKAKNGDVIPFEISSHIFILEGERVVLSVARDIRKRLAKEREIAIAERNWQMTVNSMEEVIMVVDVDQKILMINNSGVMLLQRSKDSILGKTCDEVFSDMALPHKYCPFSETIETGLPKCNEYYCESLDKYFSCKSAPVYQPNGENRQFIIVMTDITEKKKREIEINSYREELEKIVKERTENWRKRMKNFRAI